MKAARFPVIRELAGFDFAAQPSVPKARVDTLAAGQFVAAHEVVILVGNPGTGKTHVLLGLGLEAIRAGYRVRFVTAAALVNELLVAQRELRVPKVLRQYAAYDLVAIDLCRPRSYADDRPRPRTRPLARIGLRAEAPPSQSA